MFFDHSQGTRSADWPDFEQWGAPATLDDSDSQSECQFEKEEEEEE